RSDGQRTDQMMLSAEFARCVFGTEALARERVDQDGAEHHGNERPEDLRCYTRRQECAAHRSEQDIDTERQQRSPRNGDFARVSPYRARRSEDAGELARAEQGWRRGVRVRREQCRHLHEPAAADHRIDQASNERSYENDDELDWNVHRTETVSLGGAQAYTWTGGGARRAGGCREGGAAAETPSRPPPLRGGASMSRSPALAGSRGARPRG